MVDLETVTEELLSLAHEQERAYRSRSAWRLAPGHGQLDYGDDDHVFAVSVRQVARRRLGPEQPLSVGVVDEVEVAVTAVVVDNFVHVRLAGLPGQARDVLTRRHELAFSRWSNAIADDRRLPPPGDPATLLMKVRVEVTDDRGTDYAWASGKAGGSGTEWLGGQSFIPAPPTDARRLHVTLQAPGQPYTHLELSV